MLSREDRILSEILVARGLVSHERIEARASERDAAGARASPSLADLLVERGDVPREHLDSALEEARSVQEDLAPDLPEGKRLGGFRILRELGRGGMGIVYEAEQESLGRRVALKVLPAGAAFDDRLAVRFVREARAAGRLSHRGIVPVFASGRAEGVLFYAMELVEGGSVADAVLAGPLSPERAARIAAEVARALEHAHEAGLVHRDVKPDNVLLTPDGRARVADFGLVRDATPGSFTLSHHVLGTPAYLAPEQALGRKAEPRSDVYGVGAILYFMLAGRAPYLGDVPSLVLARVVAGAPQPLDELRPGLPAALVAICERALARDPAARYATARALAEDLEAFLDGRPVVGPEPEHPTRGSISPVAVAAGGAALVLVVAAVLLSRSSGPAPAGPIRAIPQPVFRLLQAGPGRKQSPSFSVDGARVVYASDAEGSWDIYLQDLGGTPRNLTADRPSDEFSPSQSPDGRSVAFGAQGAEKGLFVMDLDTGKTRRVSHDPRATPVWSSRPAEVLFAERGTDAPGPSTSPARLWAVDLATGESRLLKAMDVSQPKPSARAGRLVFVSQSGGQTDLWTMPEGGGDAGRLTSDAALEWSPAWTPKGDAVVFGSDRDGAFRLWRVAVASDGKPLGEPLRVTDRILVAPFYLATSPRDRTLVLVQLPMSGRVIRLSFDPALERVESAVPVAPVRQFMGARSPDPSPDGGTLAFTALDAQEDVVIARADGSAARRVTDDRFRDESPRWSPDGTRLAFQSDRSGAMEIWTVRPDGTDLVRLTSSGGAARMPVWSPEGGRIAYTVEGKGAFVVPTAGGPGAPLELSLGDATMFEPCSWSSADDTIAGSAGGIVLHSIRTGRSRRLTDSGEKPMFLPDSRRLLFTREREIVLLDVRSGASRAVYSAEPCGLSPSIGLGHDGRTVFATLTASAEEMWLLDY